MTPKAKELGRQIRRNLSGTLNEWEARTDLSVSARCRALYIHRSQYRAYRDGTQLPSLENFALMCRYSEIDPRDVLGLPVADAEHLLDLAVIRQDANPDKSPAQVVLDLLLATIALCGDQSDPTVAAHRALALELQTLARIAIGAHTSDGET